MASQRGVATSQHQRVVGFHDEVVRATILNCRFTTCSGVGEICGYRRKRYEETAEGDYTENFERCYVELMLIL